MATGTKDPRKVIFYVTLPDQEAIRQIGQLMNDEGIPGIYNGDGELVPSVVIRNLIRDKKAQYVADGKWVEKEAEEVL